MIRRLALIALICISIPCAAMAEGAKFGIVLPLSGPYAAMAQDMKNGAMLATEQVNQAGGVLGGQADLIVKDSQLKADIALRRVKEMVEEEHLTVIGGNLSGAISLVINEYACKNNLLYMSYCYNSLPVGKEFCGKGFTSAVIPYQNPDALATYAFKNLGKTWMSLSADYRGFHDMMASWMYNSDQLGGEFKGNIYHPLGTRDFSSYIPRILAESPDILVLNNYGADQIAAIKQFSQLGLTKKMKIVISKTHLHIAKECGKAYDNNVYGGATYYWNMKAASEENKQFVEAFTAKYGAPPSGDAEAAYVGTKAVWQAIAKTGAADNVDALIDTLTSMTIQTPKGSEQFRACDHARQQSILVLRGRGDQSKDWDVFEVVQEVPSEETLQSCENNKNNLPYGKVPIPTK
ncbi:ABC transporter substrate-binding protein [Desulfatibacillum aliphaticivorans]|uniref:ABC transporter substrate-binding protein n=1 Tax=Desulfatibacillum aliphaticivorans TaxID=218208 RepID=UPI000414758F|nr:ABC transporter substrate-binding protein [Desulfatibacillum aliphaticivorans]